MALPTTAPFSTPFSAIAAAVKARLVSKLGIDAAFIRLVANDDYVVTETEPRFVYVRVFKPQPFTDAGAGRLARTVKRLFRFYVYTRSGEDTTGGDEIALGGSNTNSTVVTTQSEEFQPGHFLVEEYVYNAVDDWTPLSSGQPLTIGPFHPLEEGGPPERKKEDDDGLVRSFLDFEVGYVLAIDPNEPPT